MGKTKLKDLALEISVEIKDLLSKCKELSIVARSSASSVTDEDVLRIKNSFFPDATNIKTQKSPRDIVKRTGAKVTIRRKKAPIVKDKEKEPEQKIEKVVSSEEKDLDQNKAKERTNQSQAKQNQKSVKPSSRESKRVYDPAKEKDSPSEGKQKTEKTNKPFKKNEVEAKPKPKFPPEAVAEKKRETKKSKPVEKKKVQIKPSKEEIIDEDAMDVLRKAVRAKLPGGRKEYLISNNFAKKAKNQKDSAATEEIGNDIEKDKDTKAKVKINKIKIQEKIIITLLASKLKLKINQVINKASELGLKLTAKDEIDSDEATIIASEFNYDVEVDSYNEKTVLEQGFVRKDSDIRSIPPIITVMGHVDHGKTSLLDYIRKSKVADKEHGGITQSIGGYSVDVNGKDLVFIDTPGHAAFSAMRSRGASLTDIIILVVAADDGVMPQTIEAISHAKSASVPIIVAVNKIDKEDSNVESIKSQLSEQGLTPEDWGGDVPFVPVSALNGKGINDLLEIIVLQADVMELKANSIVPSSGYILESYLDKGRGVVATLIPKEGEIKKGDIILCGTNSGKIRALIDDKGKQLKSSGPSYPVEILGLDGVPEAGLQYNIVKNDKVAKDVIRNRLSAIEEEKSYKPHTVGLDFIDTDLQLNQIKELPVVVKSDTQGSLDALVSALINFESEQCKAKIVHSGVGNINESDFMLAESTQAIILGFSTKVESKVQALLDKSSVRCETYKIIYEILDRIKELLEGLLDPILEERITGYAEIREVFNLSKQGKIAGCFVNDGKAVRGHNIRIKREEEIVFETTITSLKRFKDDVKEVSSGFECGIGFENTEDIKQGDTIEIYTFDKINQTI